MNLPSLFHNNTKKQHFLLVLLAMVLINACLFWLLALPYRFVPSDDLSYYQYLQSKALDVITSLSEHQNPCYFLYLLGCSQVWSLFSNAPENALIFSCLLANTLAIVSIMLASRRLTDNTAWAVSAGALYMTSAWTNNYYYFFSYAPLPAALLVLAFSLILKTAYFGPSAKGQARLWSATSGAVLGMTFWVAPAAILPIALLLPVIVLVHRQHWVKRGLALFYWQVAGFGLAFAPFAVLSWRPYLGHILENIHTYHYEEAYAKFSYVPKAPSFSFIRILSEYSPLQAGLALILTLMLGIAFIKPNRTTDHHEITQRPWLQPSLRLGLLLFAICLLHALAIDLLPTTKLGRTHFQILPFFILLLVTTPSSLLPGLSSSKGRKVVTFCYGAVLTAAVVLAAMKSLETRAVRTKVPEYLSRNTSLQHIYFLKEDPHANYIAQWLRDKRVIPIAANTISQVMREDTGKGDKAILLIGPTGMQSGNSILEHSVMADFNLTLPLSIRERLTFLPYYSFYPPFLFEEEISMALYFAGKTPAYSANDSSIKVLSW